MCGVVWFVLFAVCEKLGIQMGMRKGWMECNCGEPGPGMGPLVQYHL